MLLCLLMVALCDRQSVVGQLSQPQPSPVPDLVVVDISKSNPQSAFYLFPGNLPQKETSIDFKGNGQDWSYVWFDEFPKNVSLKTRGNRDDQTLKPGNWYWFKTNLPLSLALSEDARPPVRTSFSFGAVSGNDNDAITNLAPEQKRAYVQQHSGASKQNPKLDLAFTWGPPGAAPSLTASPSPNPAPTNNAAQNQNQNPNPLSTESSWFTYLTEEAPLLGLFGLIVIALVVVPLGGYGLPKLIRRIRDRPRRKGRPPLTTQSRRQAPAQPNTAAADPYADLGRGASAEEVWTDFGEGGNRQPSGGKQGKQRDDDRAFAETDHTARKGPERRPEPQIFYPPPKSAKPLAAAVPQDGKVAQLENRVQTLEDKIGEKLGRDERLTDVARSDVSRMLDQLVQGMLEESRSSASKLNDELGALQQLISGQELSLTTKIQQTESQIKRLGEEEQDLKLHLTQTWKELGDFQARVQERLTEFRSAVDHQTVPDSFYAKTLGAVLGENVEALQDGNFARLMGEKLNQFFETGVARGEGLQDLRTRTDGINAAVKEVATHIEKINGRAFDEVRPHLQEVEKLVTDLSNMQSQLQDRRTVLHIPVSLHAGARQTFLDGLGRGIKREIEKLDDPEKYFDSELERLITANLIAIVDICDKGVAPSPGSRPELERTLKRLFEEANLSPILPTRGEPFKAAQHDLIETVPGGQSLTVFDVVVRGFYYKHRDKETLLRKAGVKVYR